MLVETDEGNSVSFSDQQYQELTINEKLLIEEFKKFLQEK